MRTRLLIALLLLLPAALYSQTQTYATITASGIKDEGGNLLSSGEICFLPVSQSTGLPMNYTVVGDGQRSRAPVCSPIANGVVTPFTLTNTLITWPANACYRVTVTDITGAPVIGSTSATAKTGYQCVQMSSSWCSTVSSAFGCNWDDYVPDMSAQVTVEAPTLSAGTFTALAPGATPSCTITGSSPSYTLSCGLPQGAQGIQGPTGTLANNSGYNGTVGATTPAAGNFTNVQASTLAAQTMVPGAIISPSLYPRPAYLFADSRGYGVGASVYGKSFAALLADSHGGPFYNQAVGGDQSGDETVRIAQNFAPLADLSQGYPVSVISTGVNNANTCGVTTPCEQVYTSTMMAAVALAANLPTYQTLAPACTLSGFTSDTTTYAPYIGETTTTSGSTFSCPITTTGNPIGLEYSVAYGGAGTASCTVDGGTATTINFGSSTAVAAHFNYALFRAEFGVVAAGSHTLACTVTSATGSTNSVEFIAVDSIPTGQRTTLPRVVLTNIPPISGSNDSGTATYSTLVNAVYSTYQAEGANIVWVDVRTPMLNPNYYSYSYSACPTNIYAGSGGLHYNDCGHHVVAQTIIAVAPDTFDEKSTPKGSLGLSSSALRMAGYTYTSNLQYPTANALGVVPGAGGLAGGWCMFLNDCYDLASAPTSPYSFILPEVGASGYFQRILMANHDFCWVKANGVTNNTTAPMPNLCVGIDGRLFGFMTQNGNTPLEAAWHPYELSFDDQTSPNYGQTSNAPNLNHAINYVGPLTAGVTASLPFCYSASNATVGFIKDSPLLILIRQGTDGNPVTLLGGTNNTINTNAGGVGTTYVWTANAGDALLLQCSTQVPSALTVVAQSNWSAIPITAQPTATTNLAVAGQISAASMGIFAGSFSNLVHNSSALTNASWTQQTLGASQFAVTGSQADPGLSYLPAGTTAVKLTTGTGVGNTGWYRDSLMTATVGQAYCIGVWAKGAAGGETNFALQVGNQGFYLTGITTSWTLFTGTETVANTMGLTIAQLSFPATAESVTFAYPFAILGACPANPASIVYVPTASTSITSLTELIAPLISAPQSKPSLIYSAAGTPVPTCNSSSAGLQVTVSDAISPTYLSTYTSGGSVLAPVVCNGTNWVTH